MRRTLAAAAAAAVALLAPTTAGATVTIGSDLARPVDTELDCGASSCTRIVAGIASGAEAAGGVVSPVNGTVIGWRIRAGALTNTTSLRIARPVGGGMFTGAGTSPPVLPQSSAITVTPAAMPIRIGDWIGIDITGAPVHYFVANTGTLDSYQPVLGDAAAARPPGSSGSWEIALNADIAPYNRLLGVTAKPRRSRTMKLAVVAPNAGELRVTGGAWIRKRTFRLGAPGRHVLVLKPTGAAAALLARPRVSRINVKLILVFSPDGGTGRRRTAGGRLRG